MNDDELKKIWQSQAVMTDQTSIEHLRSDAASFRGKIIRRNRQEAIAALFVALIFAFYAWSLPEIWMRIGSGLVVLSSFFMLYQIKHSASIRELPADHLALPYITYFREELARQRDVLRNTWKWFIPSLVSMGVLFWGMAQPDPADFPWSMTSIVIVPYIVVIAMNFFEAHKLQKKINELDQLEKSTTI